MGLWIKVRLMYKNILTNFSFLFSLSFLVFRFSNTIFLAEHPSGQKQIYSYWRAKGKYCDCLLQFMHIPVNYLHCLASHVSSFKNVLWHYSTTTLLMIMKPMRKVLNNNIKYIPSTESTKFQNSCSAELTRTKQNKIKIDDLS